MINHFGDIITRFYMDDNQANCRNITFQLTDDCCLNCSYCYQINKGHKMMTKETIKAAIDLLFQMYDDNKEDAFINHHTKGLILEFIGGEPLMNIDTLFFGSQYFIDECIRREHIWLSNFRFNISTNGLLYFEPKFQEYIQKFKSFLSLSISIDGPKELHDSCRKDFNGNGSFDRAIAALDAWTKIDNHPVTKITIAPENLQYLSSIANFFLQRGCIELNANPIYEHLWTVEESQIYYKELKTIANTLLNTQNVFGNIFNASYGLPLLNEENRNWCGGTGEMLAFDPDGKAYPCLRYMKSSLGENIKPLVIGNVNGLYIDDNSKKIKSEFDSITRKSQSTEECFNCSIANGCGWCSAWNYQSNGTCNKRSTNICWMHRAKSLANAYYYNHYYRKNNSERRLPIYLERNIANKIISNEEYDNLLRLSFNN